MTFKPFLFVPPEKLFCSVRCSHFNHWIPWTLAAISQKCSGNWLQLSRGFDVTPRLDIGCFFRLYFTVEKLPISTSVTPQRMSDCALFPASPPENRVRLVWADRDSHLSLVGGTLTRISPRVQPSPFLVLVGEVVYGLGTVIHLTTNRT